MNQLLRTLLWRTWSFSVSSSIFLVKDMNVVISGLSKEIVKTKTWLDFFSEKSHTLVEMHHLLNLAETLQKHLEFILQFLDAKSDEEIASIKERFYMVKETYKDVHSRGDLTPLPLKYAMLIIYDKMYVELSKTVARCFKKGVHGEVQFKNSVENLTWIKILVLIPFKYSLI